MDSVATPHHSPRLVGILSSMSLPPLGERIRYSRRTTSHFDSHTMGDHEDEIPEMSSVSIINPFLSNLVICLN